MKRVSLSISVLSILAHLVCGSTAHAKKSEPQAANAAESLKKAKSELKKALPSKAAKISNVEVVSGNEDEAPVDTRLEHAKELLGKYYKNSVVKSGETWTELSAKVSEWSCRSARIGKKPMPKKICRSIAQTILKESKRYDLDPVFITAVIQSESSFNPRAQGADGEIGMMQLLPNTAKWIAKKYNLPWKGNKMLYDPVANIKLGAAYFDYLREKFDYHSRLYLSAYNMGARNVERALKRHIWPKDYVSRVMRHYVDMYAEIAEESESKIN